jgi:hypothetical protein
MDGAATEAIAVGWQWKRLEPDFTNKCRPQGAILAIALRRQATLEREPVGQAAPDEQQ